MLRVCLYGVSVITFFSSRAIAVTIFGFEIHWYGLLYLAGFLMAAVLLPRLQRYRNFQLTQDAWMSLLSWSVVGVIAGGRLGYAFFYEPRYFLAAPLQIFAVWQGGMSFHGGFLGVLFVLMLWSRRNRVSPLALADIVVVPVAIGLALGRLGNFINQELYGTVTTLPWGMTFPGADGLRHPTQLYAMTKDLLIAAACFASLRFTWRKAHRAGCTVAAFLILYGIGRFMLEYLRAQQYSTVEIFTITLTRGQILTLPLLVTGLGVCVVNRLRKW